MDLSDRVILVTGCAGNLGAACVRAFHQAGARLVLADRSSDRLPDAFPELAGSDRHLSCDGVDLSSSPSVERVVDAALARFDRIDGLVNTVGAYRGGKPVHEASIEDWEVLIAANVTTTLTACRAVLPHMIKQRRGTIVNVASLHALASPAGEAAYAASKAAVLRLTEGISAENRQRGINANCVLPGTLDTPQNRRANPAADFALWVDPASVAGVIVFLSSPAARDIHGAAVPVCGLTS